MAPKDSDAGNVLIESLSTRDKKQEARAWKEACGGKKDKNKNPELRVNRSNLERNSGGVKPDPATTQRLSEYVVDP